MESIRGRGPRRGRGRCRGQGAYYEGARGGSRNTQRPHEPLRSDAVERYPDPPLTNLYRQDSCDDSFPRNVITPSNYRPYGQERFSNMPRNESPLPIDPYRQGRFPNTLSGNSVRPPFTEPYKENMFRNTFHGNISPAPNEPFEQGEEGNSRNVMRSPSNQPYGQNTRFGKINRPPYYPQRNTCRDDGFNANTNVYGHDLNAHNNLQTINVPHNGQNRGTRRGDNRSLGTIQGRGSNSRNPYKPDYDVSGFNNENPSLSRSSSIASMEFDHKRYSRDRTFRNHEQYQNFEHSGTRSRQQSLTRSTSSLNSDLQDNDCKQYSRATTFRNQEQYHNVEHSGTRSRHQSLTQSTTSLNSDLQDQNLISHKENISKKKNRNRNKNKNKIATTAGVAHDENSYEEKFHSKNSMAGKYKCDSESSSFQQQASCSSDQKCESIINQDLHSVSGTGDANSQTRNQRNKARNKGKKDSYKPSLKAERQQNENESNMNMNASETNTSLIAEQLESIAKQDPVEIVHILSEDLNNYSEIFQVILDPKLCILAIEILSKVCVTDPSSEKGEILRKASLPTFMDQIFNLISDFPYIIEDQNLLKEVESFFDNVVICYDTLSDFMPSAAQIWYNHLMEVDKSMKTITKNLNIELNPELFKKVKSFLSELGNGTSKETKEVIPNKMLNTLLNTFFRSEPKKKDLYFPEPVGDFRTVSVFPRPEDVYSEQPFLFPNIINGPFRSVEHYLDIHFKLLREDFMSPIRQAIRDYKKQCNTKDKFKRIENVRIYRRVKFLHPKTITDKVGYEVCFDVDKKINKVNWEFSNRFMFGSLLFFTNDQFDTFFLATVANRNLKDLENKRVTVELKETFQDCKSILGKEFIMAESEAYFEPYYHVLKSLQMFNQANFPLAKYIVYVNTETEPPKYLSHEDNYILNTDNNMFNFRVLSDLEWPTSDDLHLDPSQYQAYKAALTNDLVVIQGPPGTGKTFLGLKIAQALLVNAHVWNQSRCPILVVCFTNHALDQFLEGLLPVTSKLIRIGGKSKGSELDKFNIRERRREYSYYKKTQTKVSRDLHIKMSTVFAEIKTHQTNLEILDNTDGVISLRTLQLVMNNNNRGYFQNDDHLMDWLLVGVGNVRLEKKVRITITADRGVIKEESPVDQSMADYEDQRLKQAFFDTIELDTSVPPPEETVMIHFACDLKSIQRRQEEIMGQLNSKRIRNKEEMRYMKYTSDNLGVILKHLKEELECKKYPHSDQEKQYLLSYRVLHELQPSERWKLYHTWVDILRNGLIVELGAKETIFREYAFQFEQLRQSDDIEILKTCHVVGTTTTIAAKLQPVLTALAPKIVIVEEAAEVLEAHIIASLTTSCEQLILIGDHKQLRPNIAESRLARQYQLDISLFERMVRNGMACHTLTLQHRMRPEISKQLVPTIYPILEDHISVQGRENIRGMDKNVFFMTHSNFEEEVVEITSKRNRFEAEIILKLAKYLVMQGYKPQEITILATYKGQMYHMKNEIKKIGDFPKGIQITVVDNFQGEENKIILLSIVRSNAVKKIGFLEIENRVCVALSRARDGLYIVGNMENLEASSVIWPNIKRSLVQQQAFGTSLQLRCEVHRDQVTKITRVEDFSKVSEGGCSMLCGQPLPCGHACKSMCHVSQDYHQKYKCREQCSRILCQEGHQCPKKCYMVCGECQVPMLRELLCGHQKEVPCSMIIRNVKCSEPVEVTIDTCGHTVTVPCHSKHNPLCNLPCTIRLECGHSCDKTCHVDDDPEHTEYACLKPCPRLNKDCSEDHKCKLDCFEDCLPCPEMVTKKLLCSHQAKVLCSTDLSTVKCKNNCIRTLACGHKCPKNCWEQCGPCLVVVDKIVPQCGHTIKIACSQIPSKLLCGGPCSEKLVCGHTCAKRCKDNCSEDDCQHPNRFKITVLLCGHTSAQIPCNKVKFVRNMSQEELVQYCDEPCGRMLTCKHPCSGSCSECLQGRIHKVCDQPCGNVLICGHSCPVPCREVCPPCNQLCRHKCKHSACAKKCGEVCVPCKEPCDYACPHLKCTKLCGDICDRKPCYEACPEKLTCSHPCVGFCGEPCPPCRQCEPSHFEEFFYTGDELEDDAKWVYLEDCKHTFESNGLEYWLNMEQEGSEIVSKACPQCKTPIVKVQRFMNIIKATYLDIQNVKLKCFGKIEDIRKQRNKSLKKLQDIHLTYMNVPGNDPDLLEELYNKLKNELPEVKMKKRNILDYQKVRLMCFFTEFFLSLYKRKQDTWAELGEDEKIKVTKRINFLTALLRKREQKISEEEMTSFECEVKRIHRLFDLFIYKSSAEYHMVSLYGTSAKETMKKAENIINSVTKYDDVLDKEIELLLVKLKDQIKSSTGISNIERSMINEAMKSSFQSSQKTGHWYKCKNGHIYCITECGGAMEEAFCPVKNCGEKIGGRNHTLQRDQTLASEMDGAAHPAWSDQNNMANFGFIH